MSTKKRLFLFLLLFLLATVGIGYYFYNKGPEDLHRSDATPITAIELYRTYKEDSLAAKKFTGKVLLVTGSIDKIDTNQQNETVLSLKTNEPGAFINCSIEKSKPGLSLNNQVRVKGFCSGMGQGDADLGIKADVYLTRCFITE